MNAAEKHFVDNCTSFDCYVRRANDCGKHRIDAVIRDAMILNWLPVIEYSFRWWLNATSNKKMM